MLKQITHKDRALFLQSFTKEILFNVKLELKKKEKEIKKEAEKKAIREEHEIAKPIGIKSILTSPKALALPPYSIHPTHPTLPQKFMSKRIEELKMPLQLTTRQRMALPRMPSFKSPLEFAQQAPITTSPNLPPAHPSEAESLNLGKVNPLLTDRGITMIECSGPGKFLVVKKLSGIHMTKISLSQKEIDEIIEEFSKKARIPIIGGVFKASVGNLTLAAVISEFVGSRFIINRASPYDLLEQQFQPVRQQFQQNRMQKQLSGLPGISRFK